MLKGNHTAKRTNRKIIAEAVSQNIFHLNYANRQADGGGQVSHTGSLTENVWDGYREWGVVVLGNRQSIGLSGAGVVEVSLNNLYISYGYVHGQVSVLLRFGQGSSSPQ
jgi:hypothetical protein